MRKQIARSVVIDSTDGTVTINGLTFPYYIAPDPSIDLAPGIGIVNIGILADEVTVIGADGTVNRPVEPSLQAELSWARRVAREIVLEGLADIVNQFPLPKEGS